MLAMHLLPQLCYIQGRTPICFNSTHHVEAYRAQQPGILQVLQHVLPLLTPRSGLDMHTRWLHTRHRADWLASCHFNNLQPATKHLKRLLQFLLTEQPLCLVSHTSYQRTVPAEVSKPACNACNMLHMPRLVLTHLHPGCHGSSSSTVSSRAASTLPWTPA